MVMGMTAGAPLGSLVAGRLFHAGISPQAILQVSAMLLSTSVLLYLRINSRETARATSTEETLSARGGFGLVLSNGYLRLIALLIVLLNVVNTTGEYIVGASWRWPIRRSTRRRTSAPSAATTSSGSM
jgi:AAA family ATP:ADP antiporter